MILSDTSIQRPVFASVISLVLVVFGVISFDRLSLRQYPDIDPPVVSVDTVYPGAAASVVETRITERIENRIAGIEGIQQISSVSEDGRSRITIEFSTDRDIDAAANDVRDRVSRIVDNLPVEAEPPEIEKADSDDDVIIWLNFAGEGMSVPELSDYARRYLVDRFSILEGVARVRVGGGQTYALRIWLNPDDLAARGLTVSDVETALQKENLELPTGSIESVERQLTVRLQRTFKTPEDFKQLLIGRDVNGEPVYLGDVARVEKGTEEDRIVFRGNGVPMVGIGIVKQSNANTIEVAEAAKREMLRVNETLPDNMYIALSYDTSVFISGAINEVYKTLFVAVLLVVLVMYLFLRNVRMTLIPAVTVPVSLISTAIVLYALDYSLNLLTLLALVLAIGLVVDDAIVVLENIQRRMDKYKETPLVASFKGTRQVGFAVIATTLVLVSVFVPLAFLQGDIGRLFSEFAITMAAAVIFSSFVALTLSPMLASKWLRSDTRKEEQKQASLMQRFTNGYQQLLHRSLGKPWLIVLVFFAVAGVAAVVFKSLPVEYAPKEDRGAFFVIVNGPEGASFNYMSTYMDEIETRLMPLVENEEVTRLLIRAPRGFGSIENFSTGFVIVVLSDWSLRRPADVIMNDVRRRLGDLPGVVAFPVMRQGFGARIQKPVQFVLGGGSYAELAQWRDQLNEKISESNPGLIGMDWDYKETKPQLRAKVDYQRAADLGVRVDQIGRTMETLLGSRRVTTYIDNGEEYDVILEAERGSLTSPEELNSLYLRSDTTGELISMANVMSLEEVGGSPSLNRYNRVRAITLSANLDEGLALADALDYLNQLVRSELPNSAVIDYKGPSRDYKQSNTAVLFVMLMGMLVVYLVLAAQFESWRHPFIIMLTVPMAVSGAVWGLSIAGLSLNIYSQIGLVMLIGLAAKNGILIVEFANQLRDQGRAFEDALEEACLARLRPILMTAITTAAGGLPLVLSSGAGSETRYVLGVVLISGVLVATVFTLFIVPVAYRYLAKNTEPPHAVSDRLEQELEKTA